MLHLLGIKVVGSTSGLRIPLLLFWVLVHRNLARRLQIGAGRLPLFWSGHALIILHLAAVSTLINVVVTLFVFFCICDKFLSFICKFYFLIGWNALWLIWSRMVYLLIDFDGFIINFQNLCAKRIPGGCAVWLIHQSVVNNRFVI